MSIHSRKKESLRDAVFPGGLVAAELREHPSYLAWLYLWGIFQDPQFEDARGMSPLEALERVNARNVAREREDNRRRAELRVSDTEKARAPKKGERKVRGGLGVRSKMPRLRTDVPPFGIDSTAHEVHEAAQLWPWRHLISRGAMALREGKSLDTECWSARLEQAFYLAVLFCHPDKQAALRGETIGGAQLTRIANESRLKILHCGKELHAAERLLALRGGAARIVERSNIPFSYKFESKTRAGAESAIESYVRGSLRSEGVVQLDIELAHRLDVSPATLKRMRADGVDVSFTRQELTGRSRVDPDELDEEEVERSWDKTVDAVSEWKKSRKDRMTHTRPGVLSQNQAAKNLGVSRGTLLRRIEKTEAALDLPVERDEKGRPVITPRLLEVVRECLRRERAPSKLGVVRRPRKVDKP